MAIDKRRGPEDVRMYLCWSGRCPRLAAQRPDQSATQPETPVRLPARDTCRHYGCPLLCTPRARDGRPLLAGLLAHGSIAAGAFPAFRPVAGCRRARRLQLRGQPRIGNGVWTAVSLTVFPFHLTPSRARGTNKHDHRARRPVGSQGSARLAVELGGKSLWRVPGTQQRGRRLVPRHGRTVGSDRKSVSLGARYKKRIRADCASRSSIRFHLRAARSMTTGSGPPGL